MKDQVTCPKLYTWWRAKDLNTGQFDFQSVYFFLNLLKITKYFKCKGKFGKYSNKCPLSTTYT